MSKNKKKAKKKVQTSPRKPKIKPAMIKELAKHRFFGKSFRKFSKDKKISKDTLRAWIKTDEYKKIFKKIQKQHEILDKRIMADTYRKYSKKISEYIDKGGHDEETRFYDKNGKLKSTIIKRKPIPITDIMNIAKLIGKYQPEVKHTVENKEAASDDVIDKHVDDLLKEHGKDK